MGGDGVNICRETYVTSSAASIQSKTHHFTKKKLFKSFNNNYFT